ncbi:hypothetical protein M3J09_001747 [Ascochyta lentis]
MVPVAWLFGARGELFIELTLEGTFGQGEVDVHSFAAFVDRNVALDGCLRARGWTDQTTLVSLVASAFRSSHWSLEADVRSSALTGATSFLHQCQSLGEEG